ncbi:predicted protein [Naegleria gruberi]|uniref:Predicted protein n=1 Tax=Naegleria gruberi TaxID=5762 RepID=D2V8F0_NAEGR|nr:uncharacterized protein NAEGRDRAFT_47502 [Naegleria gruberi]EFC46795.1 predicted protein [Naegleria gruberi]|eukprot:XP_002679539.1 predicted protein [Naegleria gruberi strain NEG-M]
MKEDKAGKYEGQKIRKVSNESSYSTTAVINCFPIELGILDEICSFSTLADQCSLYATCKSIQDIMDSSCNFEYHHHSRKNVVLMKNACDEFDSEVDKRNFLYGIIYRLNAEIDFWNSNELMERNLLRSIFCKDEANTGNSSFFAYVLKFPKRDSDECVLINIDLTHFQSTNLKKIVVSCNGTVLIHFETVGQSRNIVYVQKHEIDQVFSETLFGSNKNVKEFITTLLPREHHQNIAFIIMKYLNGGTGSIELNRFGWCTNANSMKGINFGSQMIEKITNVASIISILEFIQSSAKNLSCMRIAEINQKKRKPLPISNDITPCSKVDVIRVFRGVEYYEMVEFTLKIRGNLEEQFEFFYLKYKWEYFNGDNPFVDGDLSLYFDNPKNSKTLYLTFDTNYLEQIEKILGHGTNDAEVLVDFLFQYLTGCSKKLFYIRDYYYNPGTESGASRKAFQLVNGISKDLEILFAEDVPQTNN